MHQSFESIKEKFALFMMLIVSIPLTALYYMHNLLSRWAEASTYAVCPNCVPSEVILMDLFLRHESGVEYFRVCPNCGYQEFRERSDDGDRISTRMHVIEITGGYEQRRRHVELQRW